MAEADCALPSDAPGGDGPSSWVVRHAARISAYGRVLDLACGSGRHARFLAAAGLQVLAVDRDPLALQELRHQPGIEVLAADLEGADWPLKDERFDGVVVTRYLFRPRLPQVVESLLPGGVLIYETFMLGNERFGRPSNPEFLLRPGELLELAHGHGLEVLEFCEGVVAAPRPAVLQAICARRPG